jgi:hypothetical protein
MKTSQDLLEERSAAVRAPDDAMQHLMRAATGYVVSSALWVAAELKVADPLRNGPQPVSGLARAAGVNEDALYRVLRLLTMAGIFAEPEHRIFALTPAGELLRSDGKDSQRNAVVWLSDPFHLNVFADLMHSVKTGKPAVEKVIGKSVFDFFAADPVENSRFNAAMTTLSAAIMPAILGAYDFSPFHTLVDIAGGHGYVICEILRKYPNLHGILFDLEHVVGGGEHRICELALENRCRTVAGDFFESVPEGGDAYMMKFIIHDWDDEKALTILHNCRQALKNESHGMLLLLEAVMPPPGEPHFSKILDLEMLVLLGGRERTEEEFRKLLTAAGFRLTRIVPTRSSLSVIEAVIAW